MRDLNRRSKGLAALAAATAVLLGAAIGCGSNREKNSLESEQATSVPAQTASCKKLKGAAKVKCLRRVKQLQDVQRQQTGAAAPATP